MAMRTPGSKACSLVLLPSSAWPAHTQALICQTIGNPLQCHNSTVLHIAADANFRMKNHFKSGSHPDVGLGTSLSYFIEDAPYKSFLLNYVSEMDISTCSSLAALDLTNTWKSVGLHITGVGVAVCAHQGCIRPLGLGDLQKDWNYRKNVGLGVSLKSKLAEATAAMHLHTEQFNEFNAGFVVNTVKNWESRVLLWESDDTKTQVDIHLELMQAEREALDEGDPVLHTVSMSAFITMGLELEELQCHLSQDVQAQKNTSTMIQLTKIQERQLHMEKQVAMFHAIQAAYMLEATCHIATMPTNNESESQPETCPLFLPSQLPPTIHASRPLILKTEKELQYAQATDAIVELRQSLTVCAHLTKYKADQVCGQHANTRAGEWETVLKPLSQDDITPLTMQENGTGRAGMHGLGEGHRILSWIWIAMGTADSDSTDLHEALQVEWARLHAQMQRWTEEVDWWDKRTSLWSSLIFNNLRDGVCAYAKKQASIHCNWANEFAKLWASPATANANETDQLDVEGLADGSDDN
ncbi:hypothetical protein BS47DRAFT_1368655 [Hydnum rufescens UP504]|uniref:CxC2-like cysteine cluster KDZ transposase-associated domain-containing protein n=1 Tax=Hydnum rufescens UP504 TaxID=1448309 RepID=A0A9P6AGQ5_9AGAM|nr:hypothetical protein BS47DRAFT_1368655 [Hydnum rufescens UP504]